MDIKTAAFFADCEEAIQKAYTEGVEIGEAEKLAARFLHAQIKAGDALKDDDLDARMKKAGLKAVKAAAYLAESRKAEKKPTEAMLEALVNTDKTVLASQTALDNAEVHRDMLQNYLNVFREGHIYFRKIGGGTFNG